MSALALALGLWLAATPPAQGGDLGCASPLDRRPAPPPVPPVRVTIPADAPGYGAALRPTPWGWIHRRRWCVWVEPPAGTGAALTRASQWHGAVDTALATWGQLLLLERVQDPAAAQILVRRQRPPRRRDGQGGWRASHGRAEWQMDLVERGQGLSLEALITVQVGADQRPAAMAATLLHELGHAFGLWGHSPRSGDVMAASPGPVPQVELSERDRATLQWLLDQPSAIAAPH